MRSIRQKITLMMVGSVAFFVILLGIISTVLSYTNSLKQLELSMNGTVQVLKSSVENQIQGYHNLLMAFGAVQELSDPEVSLEEKRAICEQWVKEYDMVNYNILDATGGSIFDGNHYGDRAHVQKALNGEANISHPIIRRTDGELTVDLAAPLWQDGEWGGNIVGVVILSKKTFLNDIMRSVKITPNSEAYMLDAEGTTIADITLDTINVQNIEQEATQDRKLEKLASIHRDMRQGGSGFEEYTKGQAKQFIAYAPLKYTDGWSIAVTAQASDFLEATTHTIVSILILVILSLVVAFFLSGYLAYRIAAPIQSCAKRLNTLSMGDLHTPVPQTTLRDEVGVLVEATETIVNNLNHLIQDEKQVLEGMAEGDFRIEATEDVYVGDLKSLYQAIRRIKRRLATTIYKIEASASQVFQSANQVSEGSQILSQGAMDQSDSVKNIAETIASVSEQIQNTSSLANHTSHAAKESGAMIERGYQKMQELVEAMDRINTNSEEIQKIIKAIEDIAFQTNVLALNAAVEAARAGSSGKGFAVVADEVRNLAMKSSEASITTTTLIERSFQSVQEGNQIASDAKESMKQNAEQVKKNVSLAHEIAQTLADQANSMQQISCGVEQISKVIETNSQTAQHSAMASAELSDQALLMKELTDTFQLGTVSMTE